MLSPNPRVILPDSLISRQEKLSEMMKEMNDEKRRLTESLRAAETKREEAELKAGELAIKQVP